MRIIGVMPMAGNGTRFGMPFHKALAPSVTEEGYLVPLWRQAYHRLMHVSEEVITVLSPAGAKDPCLRDVPNPIVKDKVGESPTSIAFAAARYPNSWIAMAFPDTIWSPRNGFHQALPLLEGADGVLLTFKGRADRVDEVISEGDWVVDIIQKQKGDDREVEGWGAFIVQSDIAATWTDNGYISDNLAEMSLRKLLLPGEYLDLGTPESYLAHLQGTR